MIHMTTVEVKNDFTMWSHMTHIHVDWFELQEFKSTFSLDRFASIVKLAIQRYHDFNECYDSSVQAPPAHMANMLKLSQKWYSS